MARSTILLRLILAWIFIFEGTGKLFGWFGGSGIAGIAGYFVKLGIPFAGFNAYFVGWTELACGVSFLTGLMVKPASIAVAIIMVTAIFTAHRDGGFNYPLLILAACALLIETGPGKVSLHFFKWRKKRGPPPRGFSNVVNNY